MGNGIFGKAARTGSALLGVALMAGGEARAATYNFYFYNNDRDPGAKPPTVTVSDGKGREDEILPQPEAPSSALPASEPSGKSVAKVSDRDLESDLRPKGRGFRLSLGGVMLQQSSQSQAASYYSTYYGTSSVPAQYGGMVSLGYHFTQSVGVTLFGGSLTSSADPFSQLFGGGELELLPIRLSVGRLEDLVELGGLVGLSTLSPADTNKFSGHVGARLNINLGREWAVTSVARLNLAYQMYEAGLVFRM